MLHKFWKGVRSVLSGSFLLYCKCPRFAILTVRWSFSGLLRTCIRLNSKACSWGKQLGFRSVHRRHFPILGTLICFRQKLEAWGPEPSSFAIIQLACSVFLWFLPGYANVGIEVMFWLWAPRWLGDIPMNKGHVDIKSQGHVERCSRTCIWDVFVRIWWLL